MYDTSHIKLYVLKLKDGKYFVGSAHNLKKRFRLHKASRGAAWTTLYSPIKIIKQREFPFGDYKKALPYVDEETIAMMKQYGRHNVRGGIYSAVDQQKVDKQLGREQCNEIDREYWKHQQKLLQKEGKITGQAEEPQSPDVCKPEPQLPKTFTGWDEALQYFKGYTVVYQDGAQKSKKQGYLMQFNIPHNGKMKNGKSFHVNIAITANIEKRELYIPSAYKRFVELAGRQEE